MTKIKAKETGAPVKSGKGKGKPGKGKKVQQEEKENAEPNVMETDDKESTDQDSDSDATNAFDLEDPMEGSPQAESTKVEKPKARVMTATRKVQKRKRITKTTRAGLVFSVPRLLKKMRKSKLAKHIQISKTRIKMMKVREFSIHLFVSSRISRLHSSCPRLPRCRDL